MRKTGGFSRLSASFIVWLCLAITSYSQTADSFAPITNSFLVIYAVAVQPDGKVVLAGNGSGDYTPMRVNRDGSPDTNFHSLTFGEISSLALQPDGKILAAGY